MTAEGSDRQDKADEGPSRLLGYAAGGDINSKPPEMPPMGPSRPAQGFVIDVEDESPEAEVEQPADQA